MVPAFALALGVVSVLNRRVAGNWLYPPALFAAVWSCLLAWLALAGERFYPVSATTLIVYLAGSLALSAGGLLVFAFEKRLGSHRASRYLYSGAIVGRCLNGILLVLAAGLPFFWKHIQELAAASGSQYFWLGVRAQAIVRSEIQGTKPISEFLVDNLVPLATIGALLACIEPAEAAWGRMRRALLLALALVYSLGTASRTGVLVVLGWMVIAWMRGTRLRWKPLVIGSGGFIAVFAVISVAVHRVGSAEYSLADNTSRVLGSIQTYALSGVVAFDAARQGAVPPAWSVYRLALHTLNRLGTRFDVASQHAEFVQVGPGIPANVFSMYFAYWPDFGWAGVLLFPCLVGAATTMVYRRAVLREPVAIAVYAVLAPGLMMSGFAEYFFNSLNLIVKTAVLAFLVYRVLARVRTG